MKKLRKGFTIVELVIVIAVIAVLTAILIPTFVHLSKKAKVASDQSLVANLNTALKMEEAESGKKPKTMHQAVEGLVNQGYYLPQFVTKSGEELVYSIETNQFYLSSSVDSSKAAEYWHIENSMPTTQKWAIYAFNWQGTTAGTSESPLSVGFDAGYETDIENIYFGGGRNVLIRTNGGSLTINAKENDVTHYGSAESVNVVDVKASSYHEEGQVTFLEVAAGHVVLESNAEVSAVHFTATGEGSAAKFENAEGKKISIDLSKVSNENMPVFSRDEVTIPDNGAYVAEVKTDSTEYIWLFGQGIKEQMVVTQSAGAIAEEGELKDGIAVGAEDGSIAEQIANPAKRNDEGQLVDSENNPIDLTGVDFTQSDALDSLDVQTYEVANKEDVQAGITLFAGGTGSEIDPWLIVDQETFQHVGNFYDSSDTSKYYYWKVKDGITSIDMTGWTRINLQGSIEGNDVLLENLTEPLIENGSRGDKAVTLSNMTIESNIVKPGGWTSVVFRSDPGRYVLIDNVDIYGYIEGNCVSSYMIQNWSDMNAEIRNCDSSVTMFGAEACGGMTGYIGAGTQATTLKVVNSKYTGTMIRSSNSNFTYFGFNNNSKATLTLILDEESASADFTINGSTPEATTYTGTWAQLGNNKTVYTNASKKVVGSLAITVNQFNKIVVAKGNSTKAVATLMIGPNPGNMYAGYYTEDMILDGGNWVTDKLGLLEITCNNTKPIGFDAFGLSFNVHAEDRNIHIANILVTEYDVQGNVVNVGIYTIPASYYPNGTAY